MKSKTYCALLVASALGTLTSHSQITTIEDLVVTEYVRIANGTGRTCSDLTWGKGGFFGNDLYVTEISGVIYRITDTNSDGVGEVTTLSTTGQSIQSPISLDIGNGGDFGTDLYVMDYAGSTSLRFVYRISNSGPTPSVTRFSNTSVFNPQGIRIAPDNQRILLNNTQVFANGSDATIFQVSMAGAVTTWSNGSNNPNGLWDINNTPAMSPDGWFTFSNHGVSPGNQREIIQCKDLNGDGDGQDAGEIRVIVGLGAPVGQQAGFAFDQQGRFYHSTGTSIYRYTDLNQDLDYWDFGMSDFDAGERVAIVENLTGNVLAMNFSPDGDLYASVYEAGGDDVIYRIADGRPHLSMSRDGANVNLSWPASATGFNLQSSPSLDQGQVSWSNVGGSPQMVNDQLQVQQDASTGETYYRLIKIELAD